MQSRLALLVVAAATVAVSAQREPAWFGLPLPPGIGNPHRPVVEVTGIEPPAASRPADEGPDAALSGSRIKRDVETIVGFSKQSRAAGDRVWGRVTGFPAAAATVTWTAEQFRAAGLSGVAVQSYDANAPMWWTRSWKVTLVGDPAFGAGSRDLVLESALPTSGSMLPATLTAPLVDAGSVADQTLPHVDLKGKVAVQTLRPASGAYSERGATVERAKALIAQGAVAVINVVEQVGNMLVRDFGNCGGPCFNLGGADGAFVKAVIGRAAGRASVRLELQAETLSGLVGRNAVGIVRGRTDDIIIVNAHADGWFDAAGDNADGLAVLVALARHFGQSEHALERTLVFVASGGHHSTGLNGPANFVRMNPGLAGKAMLVLNLEHVAQLAIRSASWTVDRAEQSMNFGISNQAPFLIDLGKRGIDRYSFQLNPTFTSSVPGDLGGYGPLGVARVQAIHSGPMYHTSGDVLETISTPGLERAARFFRFFVSEVAKAPATAINPQTH